MEDEFTEMESEESGYVSRRTQGFEIGPINFIELVRGDYLTVPQRGDVTLRVFPPQYDAESGTYRSGRVTSTVFRGEWAEEFTNSVTLDLTDSALDELVRRFDIEDEGMMESGTPDREQLRFEVEHQALEEGIPLPLDSFKAFLWPLVTSVEQEQTVRGYLEELAGIWPRFIKSGRF